MVSSTAIAEMVIDNFDTRSLEVCLLRWWQTRTQCCGHLVAHDCFYAAQTGKHLLWTQNVSERNQKHFCVSDTNFVSATNVARAGKPGNICCGHKMFLKEIRNIFVSRTQILCPQQMLLARANGETFVSATMCPQHCVLVCHRLYNSCSA